MTPFARLGLAEGADEREVKRAYARELKRCRPDDDPQGFQALNQAYRHCLALAAQRADDEEHDEQAPRDDDAPTNENPPAAPDRSAATMAAVAAPDAHEPLPAAAAPRPQPPASRPPLAFDLNSFLEQLIELATRHLPHVLQRWLREFEPLYSLELKQALRLPVAHALAVCEPPPSHDAIAVAAECFDLDTLDARDERVRHWLAVARDRSERSDAFERLLGPYRNAGATMVDRRLLAELRAPRSWLRRAWIALTPLLPGRLRALLIQLQQVGPQWLHTRLDPDSVGFWLRATDRDRLDPRRVAIAAARVALYYLAGAGLLSLLTGFDSAPLQHAARNIALLFAAWTLAALAGIGLRRLLGWLAQRLDLDPLIALAGLVLLGLAGAALRWPVETLLIAFAAGFLIVCARRSAAPALLCYLAGIFAGGAWLPGPVADTSPAPALVVIAAAAVLPIHDFVLSRRLRVPAAQVRSGVGKLWWTVLGLVGLAAAGLALN